MVYTYNILLFICNIILMHGNENRNIELNFSNEYDLESNKKSTHISVAFIVPVTSKGYSSKISFQELPLMKILIKNMKLMNTNESQWCNCTFYISYDYNDKIYNDKKCQKKIIKYVKKKLYFNTNFIEFRGETGYVAYKWNELISLAYNDNYDYFLYLSGIK